MRLSVLLLAGVAGFSATIWSSDIVASENKKKDLEISIYNNNLALVKETRNINIEQGINEVAFEGVASSLKPETALLSAENIKVLEQNYNYDLLTYNNMVNKMVGQKVKTVMQNPKTGENIYDEAEIISATYGQPILKFSYGIDSNFPGRVVFDSLPSGLRGKPTLMAKIESQNAGNKDISLAYLTNGIGWKTNYVANVVSDNKLNLTGWVTINNESGIDYEDAKVQLIAGDVNQVTTNRVVRPMLMAKAAGVMNDAVAESASVMPESISGYHLYNLPLKTDIKDKQTKQVSLLEKENVSYVKEAHFASPLYFNYNSKAEFKQMHPDMIYVLKNDDNSNLGLPLPSGIIRFYEDDAEGSMQFVGENTISHVAKGEEMRLNLGKYFNIFADGKVTKIEKVSENKEQDGACHWLTTTYAYEAEVVFRNAEKQAAEVVFAQNIAVDAKVSNENIKGEAKNSGTYVWKINVPAEGEQKLTFKITAPYKSRSCR